jgi:basic membrane protein A
MTLEPRLLAALIADVHDQPNALPLFQYALTELYDQRDGATLTYADYQSFGGLRRAVPNRADELYASLDAEQQEAARQLFLRLVAVAGDAEGRRRILAYELTQLEVDVVALQAVIEAFARHRLLTLDRDPSTGAPTVEVAHEALLREWKRLREWLDGARADLRTHRAFVAAVDEWLDSGRNDEFLLTGGRLAEYERWATSTTLRLTTTERSFIDAAIDRRRNAEVAERERIAAETALRRRARRGTWALVAALVALVGLIGAVLIASGGSETGPRVAFFGFDRTAGGSIDALALTALDRAERDLHVEPVEIGKSVSDARAALDGVGEQAELVVLGLTAPEFLSPELVDAHPDTTWVVLDAPGSGLRNVVTVSFAVEQGAFLVGAAAALESEEGVIGFIGGNQNPQIEAFRAGFEAGARAVDPDVEVLATFVASGPNFGYTSPDRGGQIASSYYERGADVIFHAAGESGDGVFQAATDLSEPLGRHLWAIGVDNDQYLEVPADQRDHILTSMAKRYDQGIYDTIRSYVDGELSPGHRALGVASGAVGYTTSGDHLSAETIERLEQLKADIVSGQRTVPRLPSVAPEPPLGSPEPTPVTVDWDGRACDYEGPAAWRAGDVVRIEASNRSGAAVELWVQPPDVATSTALTSVGAEIAPGGTATLIAELVVDDPLAIYCAPIVDGRPRYEEGVGEVELDVRGRPAGTYTTTALGRPLTYAVPDGWPVHEEPGTVMMQPPRWRAWPAIFIASGMRAADQDCGERPQAGVGTSASDLANWLTTIPALDTSAPAPVELGGVSGYVVDVRLSDGWTERCEIFGGPLPTHPTFFRAGNGPTMLLWWVQPQGWTTRYYLLDVPGSGTWVVNVETEGDQSAWDSVFAQVEPVLESFVIDTATDR